MADLDKKIVPKFVVDIYLNPLQRRALRTIALEQWGTQIRFRDHGRSLDQHFDTSTVATVAAAVLQVIALVLRFEERADGKQWTLLKVERQVQEEVAKVTGVATLDRVRYTGLADFLNGRSRSCLARVEVEDESLILSLSRDGDATVIGETQDPKHR